jgi:LCP family protein required for cell wall assembly
MNVLQIPRDSFMPYYTSSFTGKFNSIYNSGDGEVSPIQRVVNAVQDNFGIPIDAYVTTNCYDIVSIVDLIGGIPMTLEEEMMYEGDKIIPAGYNVLTGEQAEWFVRYRRTFKGEGDIARMKNQRKFLAAAMKKMLNIVEDEGKTKFYGYLKKIYDNRYILTDMSLEEISMLADFGSTLDLEQVQVHLVPGEGAWYYPEGHDKQSVWSVHKQETLDLINANFRPYQIALTPERSAIVELVTDHLTDFNDNSSDNLEDIDNGNTNTPSIDSY